MRVKFLQDFQGVETREAFYKQGQEVDLPDSMTDRLLKDGRVVLVRQPAPQAEEPVTVVTDEPEPIEEPAPAKRQRRKT